MNADSAVRMAALADSRIPTKGAGRHLRVGGERENGHGCRFPISGVVSFCAAFYPAAT